METIKTAISLHKSLFEQVEKLARELNVSRSRVFVLALEHFIRDQQDRQLFSAINQAVKDAPPDKAERAQLRQIRKNQRRMVKGEW